MQELIIDHIEEKTPKSGGNPFFIVYGQNGEEMTTHETKFKSFAKGTRLNVEPKISGKYINIGKWEVIEVVEPSSNGSKGNFKRDTEAIKLEYSLKARLQEIERISIEAQTAYKGIIELASNTIIPLDNSYLEIALEWAKEKIKASQDGTSEAKEPKSKAKKTKAPVETGAGEPVEPEAPFPHVGALLTWAEKHKVTRNKFMELNHCNESNLSQIDIPTAHQVILDHIKERDAKETGELEQDDIPF